jgi:anti-sigma factor RsiW
MNCRDAAALLDARLDNELDAAGALSVDRHLEECRACAAQYAALENLRQEIAAAEIDYALPAALESRLSTRFLSAKAHPRNGLWRKAFVFVAAAAGLAALAIFAWPRHAGGTVAITAEILDDHLRSLQPGHLYDVESSDQHTVKPWFQGKTDFSPPVPDLSNDGFVLVGGRLEVIGQQPAAAIVYRRRQHVISLYAAAAPGKDAEPELQNLRGYHLLHWNLSNMSYWAVSDVSPADLRDFANLLRDR